jgi:putative ABC transport system substrate-binding protein
VIATWPASWSRPSRRLRGIAYRRSIPSGLRDERGLVYYGSDRVEQHRRAASYVDRILRGEKADDMPLQQPTKFTLILNLKSARTLGLDVPPMLLARADEVIE